MFEHAPDAVVGEGREPIGGLWIIEQVLSSVVLEADVHVEAVAAAIAEGPTEKRQQKSVSGGDLTAQQLEKEGVVDRR